MEGETSRTLAGRSPLERVPAVSLLMSVKDGETHLRQAIDSLLAQTMPDFELLIVDDGSVDATPIILAERAAGDPRVRVITNERNLGIPASLNRALEQCRAPLVAKADADDVYAPRRLERQLAHLAAHPEIDVLGCAYRRIRVDGTMIDTIRPPREHDVIVARQHFINSFLHSGAVFRTEALRAVDGYDLTYWTAQDSDLFARLRDHVHFEILDEVLVDYRVHPASMMKKRGSDGEKLSLSTPRRLLSDLIGRPLDDAEVRAAVQLYQGFRSMDDEEVALALPLVLEAVTMIGRRWPKGRSFVREEAARGCLRQLGVEGRSRPAARRIAAAAMLLAARVAARPRTARALFSA